MAKYIDGFVLVVAKKNLEAYKEMATKASAVWKKYGALDYKECVGEDLSPAMPEGAPEMPMSFPKMVDLGPDETVVFAYITFESRAHRDEVNAKVMADPMMSEYENKEMPFDMKRMAYGGFEVLVDPF